MAQHEPVENNRSPNAIVWYFGFLIKKMVDVNLQKFSQIFLAVIQALLIIVQLSTLAKLLKGKNNRKAIEVILWFFISSVAYVISFIC